jgi:hypothetical protein
LPYHGGVPEHTADYLQGVARRTVTSTGASRAP